LKHETSVAISAYNLPAIAVLRLEAVYLVGTEEICQTTGLICLCGFHNEGNEGLR